MGFNSEFKGLMVKTVFYSKLLTEGFLRASRKEIEAETKGTSRRPRPKHSCVINRQIFTYRKMFQKILGLDYEDIFNFVNSILR